MSEKPNTDADARIAVMAAALGAVMAMIVNEAFAGQSVSQRVVVSVIVGGVSGSVLWMLFKYLKRSSGR